MDREIVTNGERYGWREVQRERATEGGREVRREGEVRRGRGTEGER